MPASQGSPPLAWSPEDTIKVLKSAALAAVGVFATQVSDWVFGTDFGAVTPAVTGAVTVALNALRRFIADYS